MKTAWHIFNGDCALEGWRATGLPGHTLVWRENYLAGRIPDTVDSDAFNHIRAAELHKMTPEQPESAIFAELSAMEHRLRTFTADDRVRLWFDACPFDRAMLCRILTVFATRETLPEIELVFEDVVWSAETFRLHWNHARKLTRREIDCGRREWDRYVAGTPAEKLLTQFEKKD